MHESHLALFVLQRRDVLLRFLLYLCPLPRVNKGSTLNPTPTPFRILLNPNLHSIPKARTHLLPVRHSVGTLDSLRLIASFGLTLALQPACVRACVRRGLIRVSGTLWVPLVHAKGLGLRTQGFMRGGRVALLLLAAVPPTLFPPHTSPLE